MRLTLPALLLALVAALAALDVIWVCYAHVQLDVAAYLRLSLMAVALLGGARLYQTMRPDPRLAAMLFGTGFLCAFSMGASIFNYLLLPHAGTRMDETLAALDRALGFDWPRAMAWMAHHPRLNGAAYFAYGSMLPQVAVLTVALATTQPHRVYHFVAALALGAMTCIGLWCLAPSFGAFSVYGDVPHMTLALDSSYARELVRLLKDGPGQISPADTKGLIGFPSYHAVMALLVIFHAWRLSWLRLPALVLNAGVIFATPIQGGHHVMDVIGAVPVALLAICLVEKPELTDLRTKLSGMVNKRRKFTLGPVPQGLFRINPEQQDEIAPRAIKPKLSGLP